MQRDNHASRRTIPPSQFHTNFLPSSRACNSVLLTRKLGMPQYQDGRSEFRERGPPGPRKHRKHAKSSKVKIMGGDSTSHQMRQVKVLTSTYQSQRVKLPCNDENRGMERYLKKREACLICHPATRPSLRPHLGGFVWVISFCEPGAGFDLDSTDDRRSKYFVNLHIMVDYWPNTWPRGADYHYDMFGQV
jgi:hypothetical protein